jgi:hypothetical protein
MSIHISFARQPNIDKEKVTLDGKISESFSNESSRPFIIYFSYIFFSEEAAAEFHDYGDKGSRKSF